MFVNESTALPRKGSGRFGVAAFTALLISSVYSDKQRRGAVGVRGGVESCQLFAMKLTIICRQISEMFAGLDPGTWIFISNNLETLKCCLRAKVNMEPTAHNSGARQFSSWFTVAATLPFLFCPAASFKMTLFKLRFAVV